MKTKIAAVFLFLALSFVFSGCGGGGGGSTPTTTTTTSTTTTEINYDNIPVVSTSGEGTVGTSGGKVTLGSAAVAVPENAVSGNTVISLQKITTDDVINTPPQVFVQAGNYYVVSSSATEFQKPVQITIPYDQSVSVSDDDLAVTDVYVWNGEKYIALPTEIDAATKTLKSYVTNLSEDVNVAKAKAKNAEVMTTAGVYVLKKDTDKIQQLCEVQGSYRGSFANGHYCECPTSPTVTYWHDELGCVQSPNVSHESSNIYRVLTANVGNASPFCDPFVNKLCSIEVEGRVANSLRWHNPDIVVIQERLPFSWCEKDPSLKKSCSINGEQIHRLLGDGYAINCMSLKSEFSAAPSYRFAGGPETKGYECTAIKRDLLTSTPSVGPGYQSTEDLLDPDSCSPDTGAFKLAADIQEKRITIINGHLKGSVYNENDCRRKQIDIMFNNAEAHTIILGDMNFDLNRGGEDAKLWETRRKELGFEYHSDTETYTAIYRSPIRSHVYDYVISNFAAGNCVTLTGNQNLDNGEGMDHNAILCDWMNFSGASVPKGNISGTITNALTGNGVPNLTVKFRRGSNIKSGTVVVTTNTDSYGQYTVHDIDEGTYTGEASGSGYVTSYFTAVSIGETNYNQDGTVTPVLSSGQTRIVLTWDENPRDIDSHLTGVCPADEGTGVCVGGRFHIFYLFAEGREDYIGTDGILYGTSPWPDYVKLDVDDITSYGPETTTIYQQSTGMYRFSVHDYTNKASTFSYKLSYSGAQVKVYRGSNLVAKYNVPVGEEGTLWTVFEMKGNNITAINSMSYKPESKNVQKQKALNNTDAGLLLNLPLKK